MKYNSIGEQLIAKAKELDPSYKPDKFNDMSEALDVILNNSGGGKSVPPTLNLLDFETMEARTTITEEEYNNLMNGLYNQVLYDAESSFSMFSPSKLFSLNEEYVFTQLKISFNADETISYSSMVVNTITIGEKNTSNEYPITVTVAAIINPPSGGSGSTNVISYCAIRDFNDGDHDDNSFVMPTGDVVVFIDQNNKTLIGTKNTQDNVISYICYERTIVVESGQYEYKFFVYKITKSNRGYNVEKADLSAALDENILFLPYYSDNDNGKILAINSGNPKWVKIDVNSYPYLTGRINASDTQTSSFPKTDSETRVVTIENLDLSKLLNAKTIIVDADADASEVFNIACGAYGETEGIGTYVSSMSCDKKTNNLFFFYINMDIQTSSFIIKRKTIPTSTNTITFED